MTRKPRARIIPNSATFHEVPRFLLSAHTNIQVMAMKASVPPTGRCALVVVKPTDQKAIT